MLMKRSDLYHEVSRKEKVNLDHRSRCGRVPSLRSGGVWKRGEGDWASSFNLAATCGKRDKRKEKVSQDLLKVSGKKGKPT